MTRTKNAGASNTGIAFRSQQAARQELKLAREESKRAKEARTAATTELRERREAKKRRQAENLLKSASYQVVRFGWLRPRLPAILIHRDALENADYNDGGFAASS